MKPEMRKRLSVKKLLMRMINIFSCAAFILIFGVGMRSYSIGDVLTITKNVSKPQEFEQVEIGLVTSRGRLLFSCRESRFLLKDPADQSFFLARYPIGTRSKWVVMRPDQILDLGWNRTFCRRLGFLFQTYQSRGISRSYLAAPTWFVALPFALVPFWTIFRISQRARRRQKGWCIFCGYDLRASPEKCPECGTAVPPANCTTSSSGSDPESGPPAAPPP
jgi:hypothetical protein